MSKLEVVMTDTHVVLRPKRTVRRCKRYLASWPCGAKTRFYRYGKGTKIHGPDHDYMPENSIEGTSSCGVRQIANEFRERGATVTVESPA